MSFEVDTFFSKPVSSRYSLVNRDAELVDKQLTNSMDDSTLLSAENFDLHWEKFGSALVNPWNSLSPDSMRQSKNYRFLLGQQMFAYLFLLSATFPGIASCSGCFGSTGELLKPPGQSSVGGQCFAESSSFSLYFDFFSPIQRFSLYQLIFIYPGLFSKTTNIL